MGRDAALTDASRIQVSFPTPDRQDRWTVAFRLLLVTPHLFVLLLRSVAVEVVVSVGWFQALATGHLSERVASYVSKHIQYAARVNAYSWLILDRYPPFGLDEDYPVNVEFCPVDLNPLSVLFRCVLIIPAAIVTELVSLGFGIASIFIWLIVLISGRMPESLFEASAVALRYVTRYAGYALMVSSTYPDELFGDTHRSFDYLSSGRTSQQARPPAISALPSWAIASVAHPDPWTNGLVISRSGKGIVCLFLLLGGFGFVGDVAFDALALANNSVTVPSGEAVATAENIGLHASDFGVGSPSGTVYPEIVGAPSQPSRCTPVSSKPWLADVNSRFYGLDGPSGGTDDNASSNVIVMRSAAAADTGVSVTSSLAFAEACIKPADDSDVLSGYSPTTSCGSFVLAGSSISSLTGLEQGAEVVAFRGVTTLRCVKGGSSFSIYTDTLTTVSGPALIEGDFTGDGSPISGTVELRAMAAMAARAQRLFPLDKSNSSTPVSSRAAEAVLASPASSPANGLTVRTVPPGVFGKHDPADECGNFGTQVQVGGDDCYVVVQFTNVSSSTKSFVPADLEMLDQTEEVQPSLPVLPTCYDSIDVQATVKLKPRASLTVQLSYPVQPGGILHALYGAGSLLGLDLVVPKTSVVESWGAT